MSRRNGTLEIDGQKLREEFKKRNLSLTQVERECGFGQSVVSHYCTNNYVTKLAIEMFALKYNIQFDTYKKVEEVPQVENQVVEVIQRTSFTDDDLQKLYQVIYSATYAAMKRALNE